MRRLISGFVVLTTLTVTLLIARSPAPSAAQADPTGPFTQTNTLGRGLVRSLAWSPDGSTLAVGGALGIWLYTPELADVGRLTGHTKAVYGLVWSPDGTQIASASHDLTVRVWDAAAQTEQHTLAGHTNLVVAVDWHPTGSLIASGSYDGHVILWDPASGEPLGTLWHGAWVADVAFNATGTLLASAGYDGTIRLWDVVTGETLAELTGHDGAVTALDWGVDDDNRLLSAGVDGTVRAWNTTEGALLWTFDASADVVYGVAWQPQSFSFATASWDGSVAVWSARDRAPLGVYAHTRAAHRAAWNPDRPLLASLGWDDTVRVWSMAANDAAASDAAANDPAQNDVPHTARDEHMDVISGVWWVADGVMVQTLDGRLLSFDPTSGDLLSAQLSDGVALPMQHLSVDGAYHVTIDAGGIVTIEDTATETVVATLPGRYNAAAWSPDGAALVAAARNGTVQVWTLNAEN